MEEYLEPFIEELLHIDEGARNKLIDLGAGDKGSTYYLSHYMYSDLAGYALRVINERIGKPGNTVLRGSCAAGEQIVGRRINDFDWIAGDGTKNPAGLDDFVKAMHKELKLKGNNPLFLSVGALRWKVNVTVDEVREVTSPLLIFPIRLVRSSSTTPVYIEFVDDDAYFNPCLIHKLRRTLVPEVAEGFPHPNGNALFDDPVDLEKLGDGTEYFAAVSAYAESCRRADINADTVFEFDKDVIAIAQYNHDDICMYYDIKRNRDRIYASPLVRRVFTENTPGEKAGTKTVPDFVLPYDSVQEDMIRRVVNGESLIIKGPPGTGKTLTIANMIAALLSQGKKVLLASKKLSALGEVNAKLPESLRKFVMLMNYETEKQAAKIDPSAVLREFGELVKKRKSYTFDKKHERDLAAANAEKASAISFLAGYYEDMFTGEKMLGGSYYEALNAYLKNNLPVINFLSPAEAARVDVRHYNEMYKLVVRAAEHFNALTGGGAHSVAKSPWRGVTVETDAEGAFAENSALARKAEKIMPSVLSLLECGDAEKGKFRICDIYELMRSDMGREEFEKTTGGGADFSALEAALGKYELFASAKRDLHGCDTEKMRSAVAAVSGNLGNVAVADVNKLGENIGIFLYGSEPVTGDMLARMLGLIDAIDKNNSARAAHIDAARTVFTEDACRESFARILQAGEALSRYFEGGEKPAVFDFRGKKAAEEMRALSFLSDVTFRETVQAVRQICLAKECDDDSEKQVRLLCRLMRKEITKTDLECLFTLKRAAEKGGMLPETLIGEIVRMGAPVRALAEAAGLTDPGEITVGGLKAAATAEICFEELAEEADKIRRKLKIEACGGEEEFARTALAARRMFSLAPFAYAPAEEKYARLVKLQGADERIKRGLGELIGGLRAFGGRYYESYYSRVRAVTVGDMDIFVREAENRDLLSAAVDYDCIAGGRTVLAPFFEKFESEEVKGNIPDIFEHSFYGIITEGRMREMGANRNGLGKRVESSLRSLMKAEEKIQKATAAIIERRCMESIDPDDPRLAFVQAERNPSATLRSLFKKHPDGILQLKKCFILTPSTASVIFRPEEYADFDIVIVDEASQLEPVNLLPVLFRSKQCVIVGDEWQMPPIKHFVSQYEKRVTGPDGKEEIVLEPELSALTLALRNQAFHAEELLCHYRSRTESLIAFSQQEFYPHMRTFPACRPKGEGLGFRDVFVEGFCKNGVNEEEARAIVGLIREHFDKYYDEKTGVLAESFGVVAFGEKQTERIKGLVAADKELYEKMNRALDKFDDVPEKLIFFKTIETVQGQETAHLFLSLTYGRTPEGKATNAFGQLNRDKLGKCIFNVAVTRAQSSVTLVHSVHAYEITGVNVSYIHDYLVKAELFDRDGLAQFVSSDPGRGFVSDVADYIASLGISRDRIVLGYGVTEGSVKIPVAVLSPDLKQAQLGIWCETPTKKDYNYLDYNMRYFDILKERGWEMYPVYAHEWVNNAEAERDNLAAAIKKYVTK